MKKISHILVSIFIWGIIYISASALDVQKSTTNPTNYVEWEWTNQGIQWNFQFSSFSTFEWRYGRWSNWSPANATCGMQSRYQQLSGCYVVWSNPAQRVDNAACSNPPPANRINDERNLGTCIPPEHGSCGSAVNTCSGWDFSDRTNNPGKETWACIWRNGWRNQWCEQNAWSNPPDTWNPGWSGCKEAQWNPVMWRVWARPTDYCGHRVATNCSNGNHFWDYQSGQSTYWCPDKFDKPERITCVVRNCTDPRPSSWDDIEDEIERSIRNWTFNLR